MSLVKFINRVNDVIHFENLHAEARAEDNVHSLEILRVELDTLWGKVRRAYEDCMDDENLVDKDKNPVDKDKIRQKYSKTMHIYKCCMGSINAEIDVLKEPSATLERTIQTRPQNEEIDPCSFIRLPPCDIDIFKGDYSSWPTFRDLFTALYINSPKLSKVEKLFHLSQKTGGEAREIITHVPLTNDGFDIAWKNLTDRYENLRMQVNEQIKVLFELPHVSADSATSVKKLQRTVNVVIQTLKKLNIDTSSWDPILIYLCSTKLPRTFLGEFENNLDDCAKIPTWK